MSTFKTCYGLPKRSARMGYNSVPTYDDDEDDKYGHIPISVIELSRKNVELLRRKQKEAVGNCCCCSLIKHCRLHYLISYLPVHSKPIGADSISSSTAFSDDSVRAACSGNDQRPDRRKPGGDLKRCEQRAAVRGRPVARGRSRHQASFGRSRVGRGTAALAPNTD